MGVMKELLRQALTNLSRTPYSRGGDIFMEEKPDMSSTNSQPTNPEHAEKAPQAPKLGVEKPVSAERQDAVRKAWKEQVGDRTLSVDESRTLKMLIERGALPFSGGSPSETIDKTGITNPTIIEAIDMINAYNDAGLPVEDAFREAAKEITRARNVDSGEKNLTLQRIAERVRELAESKKVAEKISAEKERFGQVLSLQENQIQDPNFKRYVPEVNDLIDEIGRGRLDDEKYQALYKQIDAVQPPDSYGAVPIGDDEVSRAEARIREAKMDAFDSSKQALRSAMSQARRILMSSGRNAEGEGEREVIAKIVDAIRNEDYDSIDEAIRTSGFNPGDQRGLYGEVIVRAAEVGEKMGNRDHMVEYLLEFGLERIISRADENPSDSYPQFNLYESYNIDNIIQAARKYDENAAKNPNRKREMFSYLTNLQYKRRAMHDLFQGMKDRETYVKLVTQLLRKNGLVFVEHKIAGVSDVQMMYEQVLGSKFSLSKNWLNHQDFESADAEVRVELLKYVGDNSESLRKEYKDKDGKTQFRSLRKWEILRAGMVGRSLNTATERRITYGVMGELPKNIDERLRSLEFEFIARTLAPLKLIPDKFFDYPTAMRYLELAFEELKKKPNGEKDFHKYGYVETDKDGEEVDGKDGKPIEKGLYGKSQNAMAILDTGITDFKSNSWRGRLLLLKNKDYLTAKDEHGNEETIMGYLDRIKVEVEEKYRKEIKDKNPDISDLQLKILLESEREGDNSYKSRITQDFNKEVAKVVGEQRLFLGALIRNGGLGKYKTEKIGEDGKSETITIDLKEEVWKNVARFLPSRIAAFLPEETLDIVGLQYGIKKPSVEDKEGMERWKKDVTGKWNKFKVKLFRIERARVKRDAIALNEKNKDKEYKGKVKEIGDFFDSEHLDDDEKNLIKAIRELGEKRAKDFSTIAFPFTPFLDDVPETDWNNLEDNDLDRLVINDHSNFVEGWGKVTGLIANSGAKPEDIIKEFAEGFKGVSSPLGIKDAQKKFEPFINAYMRFSRENNWSKYLGTIMKWGRVPRSEAEKYNLQSRIALGEKNQVDILNTLAQNQVLSDDPAEADKNGETQLWRVRKRNKLDVMAMVMAQFRVVAMLFGPVFAMELFKSILPPDMAKSLG